MQDLRTHAARAQAEIVTVPCPGAKTFHESGVRSAPAVSALLRLGGDTHQATCSVCMRQSPILRGGELAARERLGALGWLARTGALACPICVDRASQPKKSTGTAPSSLGRLTATLPSRSDS